MKTKLSTKNKLRAAIMVGVVLVLVGFVVLVMAVMGASGKGNGTGARLVVVETAMVGKVNSLNHEDAAEYSRHKEHEEEQDLVVYPTREVGCMVGENWILVTPGMEIYPIPEGWTVATLKCGVYLIPITPSDEPYPYPEPEPYPEP